MLCPKAELVGKGASMRQLLMLLAALLMGLVLAAPSAAQEPEWRQSSEYDVLLRPYAIEPKEIRLEAGRPVRLRFVNSGQRSLSFSARRFFSASRLRSGDDRLVRGGTIQLAPGERQTIVLVPVAGRYAIGSANFIHRLMGMTGRIVVE
jgi:plastocyanin